MSGLLYAMEYASTVICSKCHVHAGELLILFDYKTLGSQKTKNTIESISPSRGRSLTSVLT